MIRLRSAFVVACVLLTGCVSRPSNEALSETPRPLLAPATLGADRSATQVVRGAFGEREMTMNCVVTVKGDVMTIVGLSAVGVRLFTMKYDGQATSVDNNVPIPPQLTPERLLADLQLVYWPLNMLEKPLAAAGWQLSEVGSGTRRLRRESRLVAEVHYAGADAWSNRAWLVNLEHGYTLSIDSKAL
ncbi:MAG TPA: DUF3261 domain-containing protein [Steroidobacteraceae bacterium]|nr:DUF3261 domain-containing protein [Steroidobacteraceae bacterium]